MNWPEQIEIPHRIGARLYKYLNGRPCCAIGHIEQHNLCSLSKAIYRDLYTRLAERLDALGRLKKQIGYTFSDRSSASVEEINDFLEPKSRLELYLLTWAKLGYTKGMPPGILKLLKLPEIQNILVPSLES